MIATGEIMRTLPAHVELERWYRRLLRAYPVGYRRAYGDEILTMLMDSAEPGRRRPSRADVVDLVRGAVRQWFRLPVGLSAVVAAVLSALVLGAGGAAASSWLAWQTTAELPSDSVALRTTETVAGAPLTAPDVTRFDFMRAVWRTVDVSSPQEQRFPNWTLEAAQARLRADGWTIGAGDEYPTPDYRDQGGRPAEVHQRFLATRDGLVLRVSVRTSVVPDGTGTKVKTSIYPAAPRWEPGVLLLGWLVGAVTGWILTGWTTYRLRHRALPLRAGALALGLTGIWSALDPITDLYRTLVALAFTDPGVEPIDPAYGSFMNHPEQVAATLALGVAILALAATGRRRPTVRPTAATA
ncbi:hypothetical protein [Micromonospora chersina]|uniref:hypothetical protein n=1 Tax=Micromonospora chersina TaxID=47854 RepID=UPI0037160E7A